MKTKIFYFFSIAALLFAFVSPVTAVAGGLTLATLPVAGNFDCADLLAVQGKADIIWMDNMANQDYIPRAETLNAIYSQNAANLATINGEQSKDNKIKLIWVNACDVTGSACSTTECIVEGDELSSDCKDLEPTICYTVPFKVNEDTLRGSIFSPEEIIAKGMLKATKALDEYLAQQIIAAIETYAGVNQYAGDYATIAGGGTVGTSYSTIPSALWNAGLFGYFNVAAQINKFSNPFLLSGSNLAVAFFNAQAEYANADGKANLNKFNSMPSYFDLFNVDAANSPNFITYLLNKGAIAFAPKWRHSSAPREVKGKDYQIRYTVPSRTVPGIMYDVTYTTQCKSGTNQIEHLFNVTARGGVYLNPTGCTDTITGVLKFKKVNS